MVVVLLNDNSFKCTWQHPLEFWLITIDAQRSYFLCTILQTCPVFSNEWVGHKLYAICRNDANSLPVHVLSESVPVVLLNTSAILELCMFGDFIWHDLDIFIIFISSAGMYFCFSRLTDQNIFIIMYGMTSIYFAVSLTSNLLTRMKHCIKVLTGTQPVYSEYIAIILLLVDTGVFMLRGNVPIYPHAGKLQQLNCPFLHTTLIMIKSSYGWMSATWIVDRVFCNQHILAML